VFGIELSPAQKQRAMLGWPQRAPTLIQEDLRIVLERQGQRTWLLDYNEVLTYEGTGRGVIIDFDRPHYRGQSVVEVRNLHDPTQLPEDCVYLLVETDANGRIAVVRVPRQNSAHIDIWPKRMRLIMNAPESGFVSVEPDPNRKLARQMKQAPESGYQRELILETDETGFHHRYFYFKTKDKYGKGATGWVTVEENASVIRFSPTFRLQPDGSRNLETGD
jgi:hypothetical protein